jgi:hypothetical protein
VVDSGFSDAPFQVMNRRSIWKKILADIREPSIVRKQTIETFGSDKDLC